jgi:hypothetical protein
MFALFELPSLADLFWQFATSTIVLAALAAIAVVARVAAWLGQLPFARLSARVIVLARLASTIAALALVFLLGFRLADERSDIKQMARDLAFARQQIDNIAATADDAERLQTRADIDVAELKRKAAAYGTDRGSRRVCNFDRFDVERLRPLE